MNGHVTRTREIMGVRHSVCENCNAQEKGLEEPCVEGNWVEVWLKREVLTDPLRGETETVTTQVQILITDELCAALIRGPQR